MPLSTVSLVLVLVLGRVGFAARRALANEYENEYEYEYESDEESVTEK